MYFWNRGKKLRDMTFYNNTATATSGEWRGIDQMRQANKKQKKKNLIMCKSIMKFSDSLIFATSIENIFIELWDTAIGARWLCPPVTSWDTLYLLIIHLIPLPKARKRENLKTDIVSTTVVVAFLFFIAHIYYTRCYLFPSLGSIFFADYPHHSHIHIL